MKIQNWRLWGNKPSTLAKPPQSIAEAAQHVVNFNCQPAIKRGDLEADPQSMLQEKRSELKRSLLSKILDGLIEFNKPKLGIKELLPILNKALKATREKANIDLCGLGQKEEPTQTFQLVGRVV